MHRRLIALAIGLIVIAATASVLAINMENTLPPQYFDRHGSAWSCPFYSGEPFDRTRDPCNYCDGRNHGLGFVLHGGGALLVLVVAALIAAGAAWIDKRRFAVAAFAIAGASFLWLAVQIVRFGILERALYECLVNLS